MSKLTPALLNENANKDGKSFHPAPRFAGRSCRQTPTPACCRVGVVQAHERGDIHYHDLDFAVLPRCSTV
ncbi:hypothetical protein KCP75_23680 [Salmonella enterica subsp. enterica]|nr:hypothetical protein KCP75_23680 [Salmonella enterica subsp. enterica]